MPPSQMRLIHAALVLLVAVTMAQAAEVALEMPQGPTRLLRSPTVSATSIAFAYANNIWIVPRAGGEARRLVSFQGQAGNPRFSPDGRWLAFSGEYAGNLDVTADGRWAVENEGVAPDVDVENWPREGIAGHDSQLERAVEVALKQLAEKPVQRRTQEPPSPTWGKRR